MSRVSIIEHGEGAVESATEGYALIREQLTPALHTLLGILEESHLSSLKQLASVGDMMQTLDLNLRSIMERREAIAAQEIAVATTPLTFKLAALLSACDGPEGCTFCGRPPEHSGPHDEDCPIFKLGLGPYQDAPAA